jgi:uncharacterized protein YfeS
MQFYLMSRTYNVYGGHPTLSLIPEFLLLDAADFGPAVSELTLTFHFRTSGPPRPTLEQSYANFHAHRPSLPKVVFRRSRGKAAIDIASELVDGQDWDRVRGLSLPIFTAGVSETLAALALLRKRLTAKDDFRLDAFLVHCSRAQTRLPATAEELAALAESSKRSRADRLAAMSPWERLGIDWRDFHPDARKVLDAPFYWESSNDFAPNGNDTGADLLADYRKWLRGNPSGDPILFYQRLIRQWGVAEDSVSDSDRSIMDEAAVALAFAELKLRAVCSPAVSALARTAIGRQRQRAVEAVDWQHRDDRLKSLDLLEAKLLSGG